MALQTVLGNMKRTTKAQLDAYAQWEIDAIMAPRSEDFIYQLFPKSLNVPARNNAEYREYYSSNIIPLFEDFKLTINAGVYDGESRKCAIHGIANASSPGGPYTNEFTIFMTFDDNGEKVVKMDEMIDSVNYVSFIAALQQHAAQQ